MKRALVLFAILGFAFFCQAEDKGKDVVLKVFDRKIAVYYGGSVRLEGGGFLFQSRRVPVRSVSLKKGMFIFGTDSKPVLVKVKKHDGIISLFLTPNGNESDSGNCFLGLFFRNVPNYKEGMAFWRYGPWNSWTKPIKIDSISKLEKWDIQFFYWKYADGVYGAAMPLSGQGYRTTLGQENGALGSKSVSYYNEMDRKNIPQMAVGFGKDPYELFSRLYKEGLRAIGKSSDFVLNKRYPAVFKGIGWCSWNASVYGTKLDGNLLLSSAKSFLDSGFPVRWFLVDDGWFNNSEGRLNSFCPDSAKFPGGFKPVVSKLKTDYHLAVGVWHAFDGYWNGINPNSELGQEFHHDLFSWTERSRPDVDTSVLMTCYFISPKSKSLGKFYQEFHAYLKSQGFSFVKVDNQLITERMAPGNFPIFYGAEKYHEALNRSVEKYFGNAIINCMDMTADAYLNFGTTAVARAEDDYWPEYDTLHTRNYWMSRAGEHILQEIFNSLYFGEIVYPDFDMFESVNPAATSYAVAHAINNGPTYITDKVGEHNFDVLWPLIYSDGILLRSDRPLLPTEDCLFYPDNNKPFKAFSYDGTTGLLGIWNCTDSNGVKGSFKPSDLHSIRGNDFAVYEYFSRKLRIVKRDERVPISLSGYGCELYYVIPLVHGNGVIGLVNKYNAPAAVLNSNVNADKILATLYEGGKFAAVVWSRPKKVMVDGKEVHFEYSGNLLTLDIQARGKGNHVKVEIQL
jgi:raffinose synthase